jgi:glutathione S-transferase
MLILRSSPASPFVRKIRIAASVLGLDREITIELADTADPGDTVRQQNPLGKIPALVLEDGMVLFDSRVILDYLDHRAGGGVIIPKEAAARFAALRLQALADGLMDASILLIYEGRWRSAERHEPKWVDHQAGKVARALASLEAAPPQLDAPPNVGQIAVACALGYRDFRFAGTWRKDHPRLVAWLDRFAARVPAFAATTPPPA